jgi:hypothetical protein
MYIASNIPLIPPPYPAHAFRPAVQVASVTGPLDSLRGRHVLVLADAENLRCSARDHRARLSFRRLGTILCRISSRCDRHAFFSREKGDDRLTRYFEDRGWTAHPRDIQTIHTIHGRQRRANSDNVILFTGGVLVSRSRTDVVVVASGDGDLVCDLARCLHALPRSSQIVTLSMAGSTSFRLDATRNADSTANIEVGRDCLHGFTRMEE